jgi:hypothetical protein
MRLTETPLPPLKMLAATLPIRIRTKAMHRSANVPFLIFIPFPPFQNFRMFPLETVMPL